MDNSQFIDTGTSREVRREVPALDAELAAALGRPAQAHILIETWRDYVEYPDYGNSPRGIRRSRVVAQRRETLGGRPLTQQNSIWGESA